MHRTRPCLVGTAAVAAGIVSAVPTPIATIGGTNSGRRQRQRGAEALHQPRRHQHRPPGRQAARPQPRDAGFACR